MIEKIKYYAAGDSVTLETEMCIRNLGIDSVEYFLATKINEIIGKLNTSPVSKFLNQDTDEGMTQEELEEAIENASGINPLMSGSAPGVIKDNMLADSMEKVDSYFTAIKPYERCPWQEWNYIKQTLTEKGLL